MMKRLLSIGIATVLFGFMPVASATAQETQLVVSPAIIELAVERGFAQTVFVQITNTNDNALPISIEAQAITVNGDIIDSSISERFDSSEWILFEEEAYVFNAGETKQIPFQVTPPFTAAAGGHYAQLSIRGLALERESIGQGLVFPEIGVPIFMTVPGDVEESASITSTNLFPRMAQPNTPIPIEIEIENTGNVHNVVYPQVKIYKGDEVAYNTGLNPEVLLPGTRKVFNGEWVLDSYGQFDGEVTFSFGSMQTEVMNKKEAIVVTPPLMHIFFLAIIVWGASYLYPKRNNIRAAIKAFIAG